MHGRLFLGSAPVFLLLSLPRVLPSRALIGLKRFLVQPTWCAPIDDRPEERWFLNILSKEKILQYQGDDVFISDSFVKHLPDK